MGQSYQPNFYLLSKKVRDPVSRQEKAEKIVGILSRYLEFPLDDAICLDIGCSSGIITSSISCFCNRTIGLEYDAVALEAIDNAARSRAQFIRGDAMDLPFRDNTIDVIICAQVYEHVPSAQRLFDEIYRVSKPGGVIFFSGPNWLFPVEPHYFLPFLHWLPEALADVYLRLFNKGIHYYEKSYHLWRLRHLMRNFEIQDVTLEVLQKYILFKGFYSKGITILLKIFWKILLPFVPNYNWVLQKPK